MNQAVTSATSSPSTQYVAFLSSVAYIHIYRLVESRTSLAVLAEGAGSAGVQSLSKSAIFSQGSLQMRVINAGYTDPNNLKFENITILGVPFPPTSTSVSSINRDGASTTTSTYNEYYDSEKKVRKPLT